MYVQKAMRGRGVATALLRHAEEIARRRGHRSLGLSVDPDNPARRLYESLGYRHDGGERYLDGVYEGTEEWVINLVKDL